MLLLQSSHDAVQKLTAAPSEKWHEQVLCDFPANSQFYHQTAECGHLQVIPAPAIKTSLLPVFSAKIPTSWNTHRSSPQCPVHIFDPQNSQSKQKSCFMPMYFRVLCYGAIANRYRMTKFSVVPYNYNIKLSDNWAIKSEAVTCNLRMLEIQICSLQSL